MFSRSLKNLKEKVHQLKESKRKESKESTDTEAQDNSEKTSVTTLSNHDSFITNKSLRIGAITPVPYTFKIPTPGPEKNLEVRAKAPPFHLQLDHTIGVLWCLFSPDKSCKKHLGIGKLQWALYFLKGIKSPIDGERSADVLIAIRVIEEALLECYANLPKNKSSPETNTAVLTTVRSNTNKRPSNISGLNINDSGFSVESLNKLIPRISSPPTSSDKFSLNQTKFEESLNHEFSYLKEELQNLRSTAAFLRNRQNTNEPSKPLQSQNYDSALNTLYNWRKNQIEKLEYQLNQLEPDTSPNAENIRRTYESLLSNNLQQMQKTANEITAPTMPIVAQKLQMFKDLGKEFYDK